MHKIASRSIPFLLGLGLMALMSCSEEPQVTKTGVPVLPENLPTMKVSLQDIQLETQFDGTVEAVNQATVSAQTAGRVIELHYDVGDYVEPGAVLLRLTSTEQAAGLDAASSQLNEAQVRLANAEQDFERSKKVFAQQLIAKADFDRVEAEYNAAVAREKAARATLKQARENLNYTSVEAPYGGIVLARHVQVGETVAPGTPLLSGVSLKQLRVIVNVPQMHIGPLRKHKSARVLLQDGEVQAESIRIPPSADSTTHTFRVLVNLPELKNTSAFPGTLVKVNFVTGSERGLLLPQKAVVYRGEVSGVYVVNSEQRISFRYLRLGQKHPGDQVAVLSGISEGERFVTDPLLAVGLYKAAEQGVNSHE